MGVQAGGRLAHAGEGEVPVKVPDTSTAEARRLLGMLGDSTEEGHYCFNDMPDREVGRSWCSLFLARDGRALTHIWPLASYGYLFVAAAARRGGRLQEARCRQQARADL